MHIRHPRNHRHSVYCNGNFAQKHQKIHSTHKLKLIYIHIAYTHPNTHTHAHTQARANLHIAKKRETQKNRLHALFCAHNLCLLRFSQIFLCFIFLLHVFFLNFSCFAVFFFWFCHFCCCNCCFFPCSHYFPNKPIRRLIRCK